MSRVLSTSSSVTISRRPRCAFGISGASGKNMLSLLTEAIEDDGYGRVFPQKLPAFAQAYARAKAKGGGVIPESGCGIGVTSMFCPGRMRMGSYPGWGFVWAHGRFCPGTSMAGTWIYPMGFCLGTWTVLPGHIDGRHMDISNGVLPGHMDGVLPGHMDGVLPGHMDGVLPGHMDGVLPGHMDGVLPGHMDGVLPGHMDGVLPGHMDGVLPGHMDGVLPGHLSGHLDGCLPQHGEDDPSICGQNLSKP